MNSNQEDHICGKCGTYRRPWESCICGDIPTIDALIEKAVREEREANAALIRREADALVAEADTPDVKAIAMAIRRTANVWAGWIEQGEHRK